MKKRYRTPTIGDIKAWFEINENRTYSDNDFNDIFENLISKKTYIKNSQNNFKNDVEIVKALGERIGYEHIMTICSALMHIQTYSGYSGTVRNGAGGITETSFNDIFVPVQRRFITDEYYRISLEPIDRYIQRIEKVFSKWKEN